MKKKPKKQKSGSKLNLQQISQADTTAQHLSNIYDVADANVQNETTSFSAEEVEMSIQLACHQLLQDTSSTRNAVMKQYSRVQAQRRAYEEQQLLSIGHNLTAAVCTNANNKSNPCVANVLWPEEPTLKMAAFQPEGAQNSSRQSEQLCLLCLRYELLRYSMSCVQNGMGIDQNVITCPHHNIVNMPGEYDAADCLFPMSPYTGLIGPVVRILKHKLQLQVLHVNNQRIFKVAQLYNKVDDAVPNFH